MRARLQRIPSSPTASFRALALDAPRFDAPWHFHPELELTLIVSSRGQRHVGDSLEAFAPDDLCLLGPNLPHFWQNDTRPAGRARAVVVQFRADFLGAPFLATPETAAVRRLFERSRRGLHFPRSTAARLRSGLGELPRLSGARGLLRLLEILVALAEARGVRPLASPHYEPVLDRHAETRLDRAMRLVRERFGDPLSLPEVARAAAMSPEGFCRYFKRAAGRNFSTYLNEVRTGRAAQMLVETDHAVTRIAADCGYPSLSNFNRRFREFKGRTPTAYRRGFRDRNSLPPDLRSHGREFA